MDSREDEQLKGITMKSSAIALQHNQSEDVCFVLLKSTSFCTKKKKFLSLAEIIFINTFFKYTSSYSVSMVVVSPWL